MTPIRVTDEQDGELLNRGYSYWPQAWVNGDLIYVFVGHADGRPRFFSVNRHTGRRGAAPVLSHTGTGEGWYWDKWGWIYLCDGPRLLRVNPFTSQDQVVFDISEAHPGCDLWQAHSSDDGQTHSATVRRIVSGGTYPKIWTVVCRQGQQTFYPVTDGKALDESQVCGEYLVIKEDDDNRIITLATGEQRVLTNAQGALGHSDCGDGYIVGENDQIGACVKLGLAGDLLAGGLVLFSTWNMGHVSVRGWKCLLSDPTALSLVALDGSGVTPLLAHGMTGSGYDYQVHGNLSPCGRVAMWMSNQYGRMDAFVMELSS